MMVFLFFEILLWVFPSMHIFYNFPSEMFTAAEEPLDYVLTPNFVGRLVSPDYKTSIVINSQGLRDYEHEYYNNNNNNNNNKFKILAVGDSFTFGPGVEANETFLTVIEKTLNVEMIKAGVPGYGTDNELAYFKKEGLKNKPDAVIVFYYVNDNDDNDDNAGRDRTVAFGALVSKNRVTSMPQWKLYIYSNVFKLRTVRYLRQSYGVWKNQHREVYKTGSLEENLFDKNNHKNSSDWINTFQLLKEFKEAMPEQTELIIAYIPRIEQVENPAYFKDYQDLDMPNKVLGDIAYHQNITYIDVTQTMREINLTGLYNTRYGDRHFNKYGHHLYGMLVAKELQIGLS